MRKYLFAIITLCLFLILFSNSAKASAYYNGSIGLIRNSTWSYNLTGAFHSSLAWGDVDNDGDLDLVSTGCISGGDASCTGIDKTRIYTNNGTTLTENQTWEQNLTGVGWGSLAWGDVDNDGDLDLVVMGYNTTSGIVRIYTNNGTTLTENQTWEQNLTGVDAYGGSISFGDVNKDGKLDIALVGAYPTENNGIYTNNGTAFIKNSTWLQELSFVGYGQGLGVLAWGDVDNDGDLDLLFSGSRTTNFYRSVYINNGTSLVENSTWQQNLGLWGMPSITLGDFDNDGKLDLDYIGSKSGDHHSLYKNNGTTFILNQSEETAWLTGLFDGSIAFGDYDNDGDLDLVAMGKESGRDSVFNNNETFFQYDATARADFRTDDMQQGSLAWGDVDNDGDLDLVSTGKEGDTSTFLTKVYVNNASTSNIVPNPPTIFNSSYANGQLTLTWGNGSDTETNTSGLYYNLRVGTTPNGNDIVSGVYGGSSNPVAGYFGNMMQRRNIILNVPLSPYQTIYWSVQTIDTGLAKSSWSIEQNLTTSSDTTKPVIMINSPIDAYNTTNATIIFNATVYDNVNLTNVTLYGSWSGWHINETNSSGINNTNYIFTKNLTGYGDGDYTWQIKAYDNSTNYQSSAVRTFTIDTTYPIINLVSPDSSSILPTTVIFVYNVSDVRIVNCSLIIDGVIDQTNNIITVNTEQSFTKSLSNGNYNWNINCTDTVGYTNSSGTRALTVNYVTPPFVGSGWVSPSTKRNVSEPANNTFTEENASEVSIVSTEENTVITLPTIEAGKTLTAVISKEAGVNQISIQVRNAVNNIQIIIKKIMSLPPDVAELKGVYKYIAIDKENITDDDISNITIAFSVNKSWMISNNINESTIILQRYATQWERLITIKTNESDSEISFEAQSTGFSYFAITGESYKLPNQKDDWTVIIVAVIASACLFAFGMRHKLSRNLKSRVQIPSRAL